MRNIAIVMIVMSCLVYVASAAAYAGDAADTHVVGDNAEVPQHGAPSVESRAGCLVYSVKFVWCDGEDTIIEEKTVSKTCWDGIVASAPTCPVLYSWWATLEVVSGCRDDDLPVGGCVWAQQRGGIQTIPSCDETDVYCSCFEGDGDVIDYPCAIGTPSGCPCD